MSQSDSILIADPPPPSDFPTMYRCVGLMRGQYLPSVDSFTKGFLLADDGSKYPAFLLGTVAKRLKANLHQLSESHIWMVWPRTKFQSPRLFFQLVSTYEPTNEKHLRAVDSFSIRGVLQNQEDGQLSICIKRNSSPPSSQEKAKRWQPFTVLIDGFLPESARGQFWELDCYREGEHLVMEDARLIQEQPLDKEKSKQPSAAAPACKATRDSVMPKSTVTEAPSVQPANPKGGDVLTPGKMEITLKFTEFPANVQTVENGWQQFDIDTGAQIVTVTLKPKMFKKLEQAQEQYAQWVAAIVGKLGELTPKGFRLIEPNVQVFEKFSKSKDAAAQKSGANAE